MNVIPSLYRTIVPKMMIGLLVVLPMVYVAVPVSAAPPACDPNVPSDQIVKADKIPCDFTGTMNADTLARFAWNTFIPMSWPAQDPFAAPYQRGIPKGDYGATTPAIVWDSWREKRELYQIREASGAFTYVEPSAWDDGQPPSSTGPNPQIPACNPGATSPSGHITALQHSKVENYLDETDEIGLAVLWRTTTPMPTEASLIRYQVKFNYDYYHHVRTNKWWEPATLQQAIKDSSNGFSVILPSGDNATTTTGTILAKTAWVMLSDAEAKSGKYFATTALLYKEKDGKPCYAYGQFGLIAIHVIRKTTTFPYFFFSTFEHKGNYPNVFYYANTNFKADDGTNFSSTLPNPFGISYRNPQNPEPNPQSSVSPAYPANRLIQAGSGITKANQEADAVNQGTVWANYQLVGIQYKPVNRPTGTFYNTGQVPPRGNGYSPRYYDDQDYYLANPVVETNQRFQFFEGAFAATNVANVNLYQDNDPSKPTSGTVNMGGCMGCHGRAQQAGTDFSFTLGGAKSAPSEYSAESLEAKCSEIGLVFNTAWEGCTFNSANYYRLQTLFLENENKCLEGNQIDPNATLGGAAYQATCQDVGSQYWKFVPDQNNHGYYKLQARGLEKENKCLEGNKIGPKSTLQGASFLDTCQNVTGQLWKIVPVNNVLGYFRLQTLFLENENKCLEGNKVGPKSTLGGAAFQDTCQNVSGQYWKIVPVSVSNLQHQ